MRTLSHVCVHIHMHIHIYTYTYVDIHIHIYTYIYIHTYIHTLKYSENISTAFEKTIWLFNVAMGESQFLRGTS